MFPLSTHILLICATCFILQVVNAQYPQDASDCASTASTHSPICALYIRPYSDNAYVWENTCGFSASPNSLVADRLEMWDSGFPWYVYITYNFATKIKCLL